MQTVTRNPEVAERHVERGPVGGEERIAELRKCSLPSEFGASATGSQ